MPLLIFLILVSCRQAAIKCIGIRVLEMLKGMSLYNSVQFKSQLDPAWPEGIQELANPMAFYLPMYIVNWL